MADLISRAAVIDHMKEMAGCAKCDNYNYVRCRACSWNDAMNIVEEAPAVDVVPVIRFKVCKHWVCADTVGAVRYGDCTNKQSIISKHAMPNENYFCADGERRDGDA